MEETKSLSNLPKQLCVYFTDFLDIKTIGRMTRINKHWKESLERDYVCYFFSFLLFFSPLFLIMNEIKKGLEILD